MSVQTTPRRPALAGVLIGGALLALLGGGAAAQDPSRSPGIASSPTASASPSPGVPRTFDDTAIPAVPDPGGIVDPQPVGWDHVTIWPDGRTLTVYFSNGAEACFGLDRVELADEEGTPRITLFTGFRKDASNVRCIAIQQLYAKVVRLEAPLLGGGEPGLEGVQDASGTDQPISPGAVLETPDAVPWQRVTVAPDGRSLQVHFLGGAPECYGLEGVELPVIDGLQHAAVRYGTLAGLPEGTVCVAVGVFYVAVATLDTPLLLGGLI